MDILEAAQLPRFWFHPRHANPLKELCLRLPHWRERWPDAFHQLPSVAFLDALVSPAQSRQTMMKASVKIRSSFTVSVAMSFAF
jgi:hypothetical protein